jgi:Domain of unknown function (DUF4349)
MRRLDDTPIDPEIAAALDAIDATLAGEPVDPEHAELAELALLLADERPEIDPGFATTLDEKVARRFVAPPAPAAQVKTRRRGWMWKPASATLAAGFAAVIIVIGVNAIGGGNGSSSLSSSSSAAGEAATSASSAAASGSGGAKQSLPEHASAPQPSGAKAFGSSGAAASGAAPAGGSASGAAPAGGSATSTTAAGGSGTPAPTPPSNGRKVVQSAQLALSTAPDRVEAVAQEVFDVVGRQNGVVSRSTVTATGGTDGYAQFQLSVPSGSLSATMNALSRLRYAHVSSRTDNSQDVNDTYVSVTHRLADARALRTALLKQLASAVTQQQLDSLNARIHDAEGAIARYEATIRGLNRKINFSQITLSINAANAPAPVAHHSGSFTIGKAAHDAGRVLTVAAGVALIALAALVPVALIGALAWWIASAIRHRRREQALDAA